MEVRVLAALLNCQISIYKVSSNRSNMFTVPIFSILKTGRLTV
eukprot:SAG11_NODE_386_length_9887_cov_3.904986_7_plen_43_part_00